MPDRSTVRYTYQDYLAIPEDPSRRYEIVDGELFVTPTPRFRHQEVAMNVSSLLHGIARAHGFGTVVQGPVTVHLDDEGVVEPDVIFIRADRMGIVDPEGDVHGPPDLVIEILSPSNRDYDRGPKRKQYMASGVPELWIADADERTVEVWRPGATEAEMVRDVVVWRIGEREFEIVLDEVFRR